MKQIIVSIAMLSVALALIIGVIVPILSHSRETGRSAVSNGSAVNTRLEAIIR